jgi:FRG domain
MNTPTDQLFSSVTRTVNVDSWNYLSTLIEHCAGERWIFRGVSKATHLLIPKIGRPESHKNRETGDPLPHSEENERRMVEEFRRTARPHFQSSPQNILELLAIGQHHGLPTRLLDWSESPLVAAYFACENAGVGPEPPAIYAVRNLPELKGDEDPFSLGEVSVYRPPHISPRIPAQQAVLTVHPSPSKGDLIATKTEKWILVNKGRPTFWLKQVLDRCGINRASLFPDLDGLAAHLGWRYKWSFY